MQPQTITNVTPYLELENQGNTIRFELTADEHILGRDSKKVDLVVPETWRVISSYHAVLRKVGDDYQIFDGDMNLPSTNGLYINHTRITPNEGHILMTGQELQIGQNVENLILLRYYNPSSNLRVNLPREKYISLKNKVIVGRDETATLCLDAPTISRHHATIEPTAQGRYLLSDHSANGVFVNGNRVQDTMILPDGAMIRIGPFTLVIRQDHLEVLDLGNRIRLDAKNIVREVRDTKTKRKRRLLNDISLAINPGQFVAIVGGSGAGKSTLMRALLGIEPISQGKVYINGDDLRTNFNIYRSQIGYVPQDDIVHLDLTVTEVLTYAAKLRLPPDADFEKVVTNTLEQIEMSDRRHILVSQLSGGQRKRISIGVELLADPKLFFLDEPTSGLDPGLDKKMMELLRKLADQGRTIILVTHATTNITLCDRVIFLGLGGNLCYFGPPMEGFKFFFQQPSGDFADIYNQLETREMVIEEAKRYQESDYYRLYITNQLVETVESQKTKIPPTKKRINPFNQLTILVQRYIQLIKRDWTSLALALLTGPIGIALMTLAVPSLNPLLPDGDPKPNYAPMALRVLFVFSCASLWVGLSSSLQEIVKESAIYLRERLVNLGLFAYIGSKMVVFSGLAIIQTLLMTIVVLAAFKSPQPQLINWPLGFALTTFFSLITNVSLGLFISSAVKNSSQANSALPLLLIPQIIFSGVLFKMEGLSSKISWLMLSRWSIGAYGTLVNVNAMVPPPYTFPDGSPITLPDGSPVTLPFDPTPIYDPTWENLLLNWGMLGVHTLVYLILTWVIQKRKDIL